MESLGSLITFEDDALPALRAGKLEVVLDEWYPPIPGPYPTTRAAAIRRPHSPPSFSSWRTTAREPYHGTERSATAVSAVATAALGHIAPGKQRR